ncbi:MAG: type VI secretion system protein TssA [Nitrococcus mobilis]|nr:type VI secretion system protein TssA [Nitrococcus mobilis]
MELERFLGELPENSPGGVDLAESGELLQLDQLSRWSNPFDPEGKPVSVDWVAVRQVATDSLERSRDLRAAVYLAGALLKTEGIVAFCEAMGLLRALVESHWDDVFPALDGDDATERANALFNLTNFHRIIQPLRHAPLLADPVAGSFSLLDIEITEGKAELPADYPGDPPTKAVLLGAFQAMDRAELQALDQAVANAVEDLEGIEGCFRDRVGAAEAPDLTRVRQPLQQIHVFASARLRDADDNRGAERAQPIEAEGGVESGTPSVTTGAFNGAVQSRQDAVRALDAVMRYFRTQEPSSPVPLLLERAKRLIDMDFVAILEDMAPDALGQVRTISGRSGKTGNE